MKRLVCALMIGLPGAAMADITLTGSAFMGVGSTDGGATWSAVSRLSFGLSFASETDDGLAFGVTANGVPAPPVLPDLDSSDLWLGQDFATFSLNTDN